MAGRGLYTCTVAALLEPCTTYWFLETGDTMKDSIYIALDVPTIDEARALAAKLEPLGVGLKIGLQLFTASGPDPVRELAAKAPIFLDLKFHDIPNTVAGALRSVAGLGASMTNIHLGGGEAMARAAVQARDAAGSSTKLIGVTVLTSMGDEDLAELWGGAPDAGERALHLARKARDWGLDGVVASAKEARAIREACGEEFLIVTPGIRPAGAATSDQKRVLTPAEALAAGASHLVVGRPVTQASDPAKACEEILKQMTDAG